MFMLLQIGQLILSSVYLWTRPENNVTIVRISLKQTRHDVLIVIEEYLFTHTCLCVEVVILSTDIQLTSKEYQHMLLTVKEYLFATIFNDFRTHSFPSLTVNTVIIMSKTFQDEINTKFLELQFYIILTVH